jgi:hypothetical protein
MTPLSAWENFYVIVGSSAGALIGLQFVVLTLIASRPVGAGTAQAGHAFATPTIVHFGAVLLLAGILSAPWQEVAPAAVLWGLLRSYWDSVCGSCGSPDATARRIQARVRGLAVSCSAAVGGVYHAGRSGLCGRFSFKRRVVWYWRGGIAAAICGHPQCMGCGYVPRV